ncbi:hypothetical protein GPECTOR_1227g486 [Gonium pectorale]|uniref:Uncharacterized protein n=1 Tax=Gonium pectorale TaxID=33097 RepID=A0A150FTK6_GONPE|nr:hypothetical protein GPECTOR_1227g486 [Gonium pectorale]|eukprot:KXZ40942.1 hypothetical protein GPECTOR_1227g486 [Gonium pectorale]
MVEGVFGKEFCGTVDAFFTDKNWLVFTVLITLFALYAVDTCDVCVGSVQARTIVSGLLLAIFVIFALEVVLSCVFVDRYLLSFFFWVDLIGTASLILDIQWMAEAIISEADSNALQITRAGRAARLGSQMGG